MNKYIAEFFTSNKMTINGNEAYGVVRGYEVFGMLSVFDSADPFKLHVSFYATEEQKRNIEECLRRAEIKRMHFSFTEYGLYIGLNDLTVKKLAIRLPSIVDVIFGALDKNGASGWGYCPSCGKPVECPQDKTHTIGSVRVTLCDECFEKINKEITKSNKEFEQAPNNYLFGFCGALIGGIVGAALSVLIYVLGYVSSISAIVAVLLGSFLYQKFHGKPNAMMIVIVSATSLVCMAASIFITYVVAAGISAAEAGVNMTSMEAFKFLMSDAAFSRAFYGDLGMVLLFSAIGVGFEVFYLSKKIKRQKNIK